MAFIGKKPTAAPLTSSDVADGIITNAKLAQDIISADTALGAEPADTDELLVSDAGTLKRMDYSYIKASPGWIKIGSTVTASDSSTVDFDDIASTYSMYCIMGSNIRPTTDNVSFEVNFGTDGSTYAANKTSVFAYDYNNDAGDDSEGGGLSAGSSLDNSTIRSSTGLSIDWYTVVGPLNFSFSEPLTSASTDKAESFRFNIGTTF